MEVKSKYNLVFSMFFHTCYTGHSLEWAHLLWNVLSCYFCHYDGSAAFIAWAMLTSCI